MRKFGKFFSILTVVVLTASCGLQTDDIGASHHGVPIVEGDLSGCGDDICVADVEFWETCPADCPYEGYCGDSVCDADEIAGTCPGDCSDEPDECDFRGQRVCAEDGSLLVCVWRAGDVGALNYARLTCADGETCSDGECVEIPPECGDGSCDTDIGETCENCSGDCGECPSECGDEVCDPDEDCSSCAEDCACAEGTHCSEEGECIDDICGDGICQAHEDCGSCYMDCGCADGEVCVDGECVDDQPTCPDDVCDPDENCETCPDDCACAEGETCFEAECLDHYCTDGVCDDDEDAEICPDDCRPFCGDATCHRETEDCGNCPQDCGCADGETCTDGVCLEPEPVCGDGECTGDESCDTCDVDCGGCLEICGDGVCGRGEFCEFCPEDCGDCPRFCGDGSCDEPESPATCACDCRFSDSECLRGDRRCADDDTMGLCVHDYGLGFAREVIVRCPRDFVCFSGECVPEPECGDDYCDPGESCSTCPDDCGDCPDVCGDDVCQDSEACETCSVDCGDCPRCGDGICQPEEDGSCGERCVPDCGPCDPVCGNGECEIGEDCDLCPADCGCADDEVCSDDGECVVEVECGDGICQDSETCETCSDDCGACPPAEGTIICERTDDALLMYVYGPGPLIGDLPPGESPIGIYAGCDNCGGWSPFPYDGEDPRPFVLWDEGEGWDADYVLVFPPHASGINLVLWGELGHWAWFDLENSLAYPGFWNIEGDCERHPGKIFQIE